MSNPKDAGIQRQSFMALFENVAMSKRAYDYSMELQVKLPVLVLRLSNIVAENKQNLEKHLSSALLMYWTSPDSTGQR